MAADLLGEHRRTFQRQLKRVAKELGLTFPKPGPNVDLGAALALRRRGLSWRQIQHELAIPYKPEALRLALKRSLASEVHHDLPGKAWDAIYDVWTKSPVQNLPVFAEQLGMAPVVVRRELARASERRDLLRPDRGRAQRT